jgi:rhodanese-related sulfurtransferase
MQLTPEEALEKMEEEDYVYIDVRSINEFEGGHPEGAYNIPLKHMLPGGMADNEDFLAVMKASFAKDAKLIVACKAGGRSLAAIALLNTAGFEDVLDQFAGFTGARDQFGATLEPGWQATGLPISIEAEAGRDYAALAEKAGKVAP